MPQRIGNLKNKLITQENFDLAFEDGTEHKRTHPTVRDLWTEEAKQIWVPGMDTTGFIDPKKRDALRDSVLDSLSSGTYQHKPPRHKRQYCTSKSKGITGGKWRDIYCPALDDHIVQHMVFNVCEPAFMKGMYRFCVGNVPKRGTGEVIRTVTHWCKNCNDWTFFVKLDIRHFFESIQKDDEMYMLDRKIKDDFILRIHDSFLSSAPVPVPVGYFISPWYGNLVLERLDHFITENLFKYRRDSRINFVSHYIRFVDDMLLMGTSKRGLQKAIREIDAWLKDNLGMKLKPNWEIKRIAEYDEKGKIISGTYQIDFIGYRFDRTRTILRDTVYLSTKRLANSLGRNSNTSQAVTYADCQTYVSKVGLASHIDNARLMGELNNSFPILEARRVISDGTKCRVLQQT